MFVGKRNEIKSSSIETEPTCPLDLFWNRHAIEYPPIEMEGIDKRSNVRASLFQQISNEFSLASRKKFFVVARLVNLPRSTSYTDRCCITRPRFVVRPFVGWETLFFLKLANHLVYTRKFLETNLFYLTWLQAVSYFFELRFHIFQRQTSRSSKGCWISFAPFFLFIVHYHFKDETDSSFSLFQRHILSKNRGKSSKFFHLLLSSNNRETNESNSDDSTNSEFSEARRWHKFVSNELPKTDAVYPLNKTGREISEAIPGEGSIPVERMESAY